jgi:hypothetical protein
MKKMKKIILAAIAATAVIACANVSSPDANETLQPVSAEYISSDTTINFENDAEGKVPNGFTQTATGKQQTLNWQIVNDGGNKVAAQQAKNGGDYYNLLVLDNPGFENFTMSVKIKAVAGNEDQGGGLIWRYIDNNNYYVARYNPLESNFRLYHVVNGNRRQLKSIGSTVKSREWFTMSIEMNGNKISCSLNGKKLIETSDDTFKKGGKVGLWSKADAQTYFDDLTVQSLK